MKLALFGGSFDPPHIGHKKIITKALKELDIDKIFVNVAYLNPFKSTSKVDAKTRLKWMKKICKGIDKAKVLSYEVEQNRAVPTIETVKYLYKNYKIEKLYLIIGADNLKSLKKWYKYNRLKKLVEFVAVTRNKIDTKKYKQLKLDVDISSTKQREQFRKKYVPKEIRNEVRKFYG